MQLLWEWRKRSKGKDFPYNLTMHSKKPAVSHLTAGFSVLFL